MADRFEDFLPHNWSRFNMIKDGSPVECFFNNKTGRTLYSEEEFKLFMTRAAANRPPRLTETKTYRSLQDLVKQSEEETYSVATRKPVEEYKWTDMDAGCSDETSEEKPNKRRKGDNVK